MRKYTQDEFDKFGIVVGLKQCPKGDYSNINTFAEWCSFDDGCIFADGCSFDKRCTFGQFCILGHYCTFGEYCTFGKCCSFGEGCRFGEQCSFGECSTFGKRCSFEKLEFESDIYYIRIDSIGSRGEGCYIFNAKKGIVVRCGCFIGTKSEFLEKVKTTHANTKHEETYALAVKLAESHFQIKTEGETKCYIEKNQ